MKKIKHSKKYKYNVDDEVRISKARRKDTYRSGQKNIFTYILVSFMQNLYTNFVIYLVKFYRVRFMKKSCKRWDR